MLVRRTNILFDDDLWKKLIQLAKEQKKSIGELTRNALKETYFSHEDKIQEDRKKAVEEILAFRKKYGKKLGKGEDSAIIIRQMRDTRYGRNSI